MTTLTEDDVRRLLPMREAIRCLRDAFAAYARGEAQNQPRRRLHLPTGAVLHALAGAYGKYFGTKIYSTHPKHGAHFTFLLYDAETGKPLAQMEANHLGQIRTGAASGLAAGCLAPERSVTVAVIGSGFQAETQLEAVAAVRSVSGVRVFSRDAARREEYAGRMAARIGVPVSPAASAEAAAEGADIVITATYAKDPVIHHVPDRALVLAVGSNHPARRELPAEIVRSARIVVDDREACRLEAGDLLLALDEHAWDGLTELKDLVSGKAKAGHEDRLRVFKSVGLGLEDVAAGGYVYERATLERKSAGPNPATR